MRPGRVASTKRVRAQRLERTLVGLGSLLFVAAQATQFGHGVDAYSADAHDYARVGRKPWLSLQFWANRRAPGFPFVWRLLDFQTDALYSLQIVFGAVAWLALAWEISRVPRHRTLRVATFWIVLLMALGPQVAQWNNLAGSESLSFSFGVIAVAAALGWVRRPEQWWRAVVLVVASLLFALTRDANGQLLAIAGVVVLLGVLARWLGHRGRSASAEPNRRRVRQSAVAVVGVALLTCGGLSYLSSEHGERWMYPYWDTLRFRVLTHPDQLAWFVDRGLPVADLRAVGRALAAGNENPISLPTDQRFARLEAWTRSKGRSVYLEYLRTHPDWVLDGATAEFNHQISSRVVETYGSIWGYRAPPGGFLTDVVFVRVSWVCLVWLLGVTAALLGLAVRGLRERGPTADGTWIYAWCSSMVAVLVVFVAVWIADPYEGERHEIVAIIAFRLLLWLGTIFAVDRWWTQLAGRSRDRATARSVRSGSDPLRDESMSVAEPAAL